MSARLPPVIARLIPRLGSPFDAEVVATARAIERSLKSQRLDWHDLAKTATGQSPLAQWDYEPRRSESEMRAWLTAISREPWLNEWTTCFVGDLLRRYDLCDLSAKQRACLDRIIRRARDRGVRPEREAA